MSQELYLIGVSKSYSNRGKKINRRYKPQQLRVAFYIDEDFKIKKRHLSKSSYIWNKYFKVKYSKRKFKCKICKYTFQTMVKKSEKLNPICSICRYTD